MIAWWNKSGECLLMIAVELSLVFLWLAVRATPEEAAADDREFPKTK
jgi:hypothetical protein